MLPLRGDATCFFNGAQTVAPTKLMVPLININTNITSLNQYDSVSRGTGLEYQIGSCCLELPDLLDLLTLAKAIKKQLETSDCQGSSAMITVKSPVVSTPYQWVGATFWHHCQALMVCDSRD